jgi:hypothetical protein
MWHRGLCYRLYARFKASPDEGELRAILREIDEHQLVNLGEEQQLFRRIVKFALDGDDSE